MSTCDGPPFMNRKITRLARAGKCGGLGASGLPGTAASASPGPRSPPRRPAPPATPRRPARWPGPARRSRRRSGRTCARRLIGRPGPRSLRVHHRSLAWHRSSRSRSSIGLRLILARFRISQSTNRNSIRPPAGPGHSAPSGSASVAVARRAGESGRAVGLDRRRGGTPGRARARAAVASRP